MPGTAGARKAAAVKKANPAPARTAEQYLRRGIALSARGRCTDALFDLAAAVELKADPIAHFYLGRCHERGGDVTAALRAYSRFVFEAPESKRATFAAKRIAALEARLVELEASSTPPGAESARPPTTKPGWKAGAAAPSLAPHAPGSLPVGTGVTAVGGAGDAAPRLTLRAVRTARPPDLDGALDEPEWRKAAPSTTFMQKAPFGGRAPGNETTLRILYDDDAIYVAFDCEQRGTPVVALLSRRDRPVETDSVTVAFDSRGEGRSAFEFTVSAAGTLIDGIRFDDGKIAREWDEIWEAQTQVREGGWSAELRIPLRALRFEKAPEGEWGLQARRYVSTSQETDEWAYVPREAGGEVSHYGRLRGLNRLQSDHSLQLSPFVLGQVRHQAPDPSIAYQGWSHRLSAGLDFKWRPEDSVSLDGTVNPDFGQVEADQLILNLSKVELLFPEKRPFFLAGMDDFATNVPIFYSRRIGRTPSLPPLSTAPPGAERLHDFGQPSPIYGALKLAADLPGGWTVAGLSALTGPNHVDVVLPAGARVPRLIDPLTSFNVLRLRKRLARRFDVGLLATGASRGEPVSGLPDALTASTRYPVVTDAGGAAIGQRCPGGQITVVGERCFHDAYVGSADFVWTSPEGEYAVRGQTYGSVIHDGPARALPDGTSISSGDLGGGGLLRLSKQGGEHWLLDGSVAAHGRKLDYNDLGYMIRQNHVRVGAYAEYRTLEPFGGVLETHTSLLGYGENNLDGLALGRGLLLTENVVLQSRWTFTLGGYLSFAHFDDREVGDGTALERATLRGAVQAVASDPTRPLSFSAQVAEEHLDAGGNLAAQLGLLWQPISAAQLQVLSTYTQNVGEPRYAGTGVSENDLVFGRLDARSAGLTLRAACTLVPTLTLQAYAQAFLASGGYYDFAHFLAPLDGPRSVVRLSELASGGDPPPLRPDFERASLAVNVVLRWEYRLGSILYLLWVRSQNPTVELLPTQLPRLDPAVLRTAPASDVIMLKLSYWIG